MYRIFISLIILLICNACELVSEIDYKEAGNAEYIVVYGFFNSEEGVNVLVKKTVPVNMHEANDVIGNPNVWLFENEKPLKQLMQKDEYTYCLSADSLALNRDASYRVKVEADGFETVQSTQQQMVHKTIIDTAYIDADSNFVYCEFADDPAVKNYYAWKVHSFYDGKIKGTDTILIVPNYTFNDEGFNGKIVKYADLSRGEFDSIQIKLYSVSKSYADFIESYLDYELSYGDYNYENVYPVHSYIENGLGFFVSYEVSEYVIRK
ncbi:DUF4249 family protein [Roseimarinus sediminis]|jgi:hypothetical protein|uniref:DUF4249 family protein n=1 Tax=Roseimarinus sediminis TaxID=1610899 RepID=UPI003D2170CD